MISKNFVNEIKEDIAIKYGYTTDMPTKWNFAMLLTHRRKQQIDMYDALVETLELINIEAIKKIEELKTKLNQEKR